MNEIRYRPDIDGLRAVAVLSVVFYHAFPGILIGGFVGVDIFFVISGFLIGTIILRNLEKGTFSFADFYARRIVRIFPSLILVLGLSLGVAWLVLLPLYLRLLGAHVASASIFGSNFRLMAEAGYFDQTSEAKPLLHLWSLGVEEQFYLLWPLTLWTLKKTRVNLWAALGFIFLFSFSFCVKSSFDNPTESFFSPLSRLWELDLGCMLAWLFIIYPTAMSGTANKLRLKSETFNDILSLVGSASLIASVTNIRQTYHFPGAWALEPVLGTACFIAAGPQALINKRILSLAPFVWIGLISYPLYLWHWPLLSFSHLTRFMDDEKYRWLIVLVSIFLAWMSYLFFEKPFRFRMQRSIAVPALLFLMVIMGSTGLIFRKSDGFLSRYPPEVRAFLKPIPFEFEQNVRLNTCFFNGDKDFKGPTSDCIENRKPTIFLWGDSFAAALYPGLHWLQSRYNFGITQWTTCGTPPFPHIDWDNPCTTAKRMNERNQEGLNLVKKTHPDVILLHAFWGLNNANASAIAGNLKDMLSLIKKTSPTSKVVVFGPPPSWGTWDDGLPHLVAEYWLSHRKIPDYMTFGLNDGVITTDDFLAKHIPEFGADYVSLIKVFCKSGACLTRTGPKPTDLTSIDIGHLSKTGSEYLFQRLEGKLVPLLFLKKASKN